MTKNELRKEIINRRNALSQDFIKEKSSKIIKKLFPYIEKFQNIMIFINMKNEIEITKLTELYPNKIYFIPKTLPNREMKINLYNKKDLILHKFGYYESFSEDFYSEDILDIIIVPALAFDRNKNRIGFGGGYYDRFLHKIKENHNNPLIIGVCYDFQVFDNIPSEIHDVKMDFVITEKTILY